MVRVDIDLGGASAKLSEGAVRRGRYALANQMLADMNQFVPRDEGILRMAVSIDISGDAIVYHMPYAARQFYEQAANYTTPGTGPRWDEKAKGIYMDDWERAFMRGAGW